MGEGVCYSEILQDRLIHLRSKPTTALYEEVLVMQKQSESLKTAGFYYLPADHASKGYKKEKRKKVLQLGIRTWARGQARTHAIPVAPPQHITVARLLTIK